MRLHASGMISIFMLISRESFLQRTDLGWLTLTLLQPIRCVSLATPPARSEAGASQGSLGTSRNPLPKSGFGPMSESDSKMYGLYAAFPPLEATALSMYSCEEKENPSGNGPGTHSGMTLKTIRKRRSARARGSAP